MTIIRLTLPFHMELLDWANQIVFDMAQGGFGYVPELKNIDDWRQWAYDITQLPQVSALTPPNPFSYSNWQDWANDFIRGMSV